MGFNPAGRRAVFAQVRSRLARVGCEHDRLVAATLSPFVGDTSWPIARRADPKGFTESKMKRVIRLGSMTKAAYLAFQAQPLESPHP